MDIRFFIDKNNDSVKLYFIVREFSYYRVWIYRNLTNLFYQIISNIKIFFFFVEHIAVCTNFANVVVWLVFCKKGEKFLKLLRKNSISSPSDISIFIFFCFYLMVLFLLIYVKFIIYTKNSAAIFVNWLIYKLLVLLVYLICLFIHIYIYIYCCSHSTWAFHIVLELLYFIMINFIKFSKNFIKNEKRG